MDEKKDPVLELVMSAQARVEAASKAFTEIMKRYGVVPVVVEQKRGGVVVTQGIEWMPQESLQGPNHKPLIIH
jgi:hypothetical protein